ncbi:MAG: polymer-forming cytoskeletal protein, partial [Planctomycetota bacterium]
DLGSSTLNTNQQASSNSKIKMPGSGAKISGHAWSASEIEDPSRVTGLAEAFQSPAREAPGANVFDYYLANGAEIEIGDIPTFAGVHTISTVVLSPASNPFGDTNPEGVYYIDCKGQRLNILWSRIVGTLVLLNAGAESGVTAELQWDPAVPNYPALLVDGDFSFDMTGLFGNHALWEGTLSKNFNPSGTPYEGNTDSDKIDIYPGWINGLVYVSGKIEINDESYFNGAVVAGEVELNQDATFNYSGSFLASPPPGFSGDAGGPQRVSPGTWRHAAY